MKTIVLYLGNPIVSNDQIGLIIGRRLDNFFISDADIDFFHFTGSPLGFISQISGYGKLIIIDSISTGNYTIGTVVLFSKEEILDAGFACHLHGMNLPEALSVSKKFSMDIPTAIYLVGIEAGSIYKFGLSCDPELEGNIDRITDTVTEMLSAITGMNSINKVFKTP